jgi:MinD superfamily P-loop ATPase
VLDASFRVQGHVTESRKAADRLFPAAQISATNASMQDEVQHDSQYHTSLLALLQSAAVGVGLQVLQQLAGINTVMCVTTPRSLSG